MKVSLPRSHSKLSGATTRTSRRVALPPPAHPAPAFRAPQYSITPEKVLLYADRGIVVINKPNGLIAQLADPRSGQNERAKFGVDPQIFSTLLDDLRETLGLHQPLRTVHRLDKPTTGALAFACSKEVAKEVTRQLSRRQIQKTYLALVCGDASMFQKRQGLIETELECRNGLVRIPGAKGVYERIFDKPRVERPHGENWTKNAVSEYEVIASSSKVPITLLRLQLLTGIKHQLRVHLAQHVGTPILGDSLYMDPRAPIVKDIRKVVTVPTGLYLHSSRFTMLRYRPSEFRLTVGAPLPPNFVKVCQEAGIPLDIEDETGGVWEDVQKVRGVDIVSPEDRGDVVEDAVRQLQGRWYGPSRRE